MSNFTFKGRQKTSDSKSDITWLFLNYLCDVIK